MLIQLDAVGKIVFNQKLNFSTHCLAPHLQDQKLCLHSLNRVPRSSGIWCRHGISPTLKSTASIQSSRVDNKSLRLRNLSVRNQVGNLQPLAMAKSRRSTKKNRRIDGGNKAFRSLVVA